MLVLGIGCSLLIAAIISVDVSTASSQKVKQHHRYLYKHILNELASKFVYVVFLKRISRGNFNATKWNINSVWSYYAESFRTTNNVPLVSLGRTQQLFRFDRRSKCYSWSSPFVGLLVLKASLKYNHTLSMCFYYVQLIQPGIFATSYKNHAFLKIEI